MAFALSHFTYARSGIFWNDFNSRPYIRVKKITKICQLLEVGGYEGHKHRWEDYIKESTDKMFRMTMRMLNRKEKIKKILDVNKHNR